MIIILDYISYTTEMLITVPAFIVGASDAA